MTFRPFFWCVVFIACSVLSAPLSAEDFPGPVETALQSAESQAGLRVSYTMVFQWPGVLDIVQRYDANLDQWTPISGDPSQLDANGAKKFRTYKRVESKPGGLTYADYRSHLRDVRLISEDDGALVYSFLSPQTPGDVVEAAKVVETRLVIDRTSNALTRYSVKALQPFKPNVASKLEEFDFQQDFEKVLPNAPALMTRVYWRAKGRRAFSNVDETYTVLFRDFEFSENRN